MASPPDFPLIASMQDQLREYYSRKILASYPDMVDNTDIQFGNTYELYIRMVNAGLLPDFEESDFTDLINNAESPTRLALDSLYLPKPADVNYFVSSVGSNSNDGLAAETPFLTIQYAVDTATNLSLGPGKKVAITVAAGSYSGRVIVPSFTQFALNLVIQGPEISHPNVPTVTQTEGSNAAAVAFFCANPNVQLTVRNIKFIGYRNTTASAGISIAYGAYVKTENCHFENCYWGVSGQKSNIDVKGGIYTHCGELGTSGTGNGAGIRSLQQNRHAIGLQNAGNNSNGPEFHNCTTAIFAQELSTGHADWVTIEDCTFGVNAAVQARINLDGTSFKRNSVDIRTSTSSNVYITANTSFGTGADESTVKLLCSSNATVQDDNRLFTNIVAANGSSFKGADTQFPNTVVTSTTTQVVYTATLGAPLWRNGSSGVGKNRKLNVKIYGTFAGTNDVKDVTVRLGTSLVSTQFTATEVGSFEAEASIYCTDTEAQFMSMRSYRHLGTSIRVSQASATNTMLANTNMTVEARVGNASDSVTIKAIDLSWA